MKCVEKNGRILRVSDIKAQELIKEGGQYCPKWRWKAQFDKNRAEKAKGRGNQS